MSPSWTRACGIRLIGSDVRIIGAVPSAIDGGVRKTCRLSLARRRQRSVSTTASVENRPSLREVGRLEALGESAVDAPESIDERGALSCVTHANEPTQSAQLRHPRLDPVRRYCRPRPRLDRAL